MAEVDKLVVKIAAEFGELKKDLDEAKKEIRGLGTTSKKANKSLAMLGKGLKVAASAAAAAGTATGALALKQLEAARATDILAKRVGIARTALSQLGAAGNKFGVDVETLADAMKDLNVKITDAANGAKAYDEIFTKIGLSSKELVKLNPQQQFLKFADAIKKADENTRHWALDEINDAMFQLVPLMKQGSEAIKAIGDEALRSGKALSEFEFKELEKANKAMLEMSQAVTALGNALAIHLAPGLKLAAEWATALSDSAKELLGQSDTAMRDRLAEITKEFEKMGGANKRLNELERIAENGGRSGAKARAAQREIIGMMQEKVRLEQALRSAEASSIGGTSGGATGGAATSASGGASGPVSNLAAMKQFKEDRLSLMFQTELEAGELQAEADAKRLEAMKTYESEKLNLMFETALAEADQKEAARLAEEEAHKAWLDRMFGHDQRAQEQNMKLWEHSWQGKAMVTSKFLGQISNLMNTNSRKQFEIGKAAAIAQVAIDTPKAAMSAYSAMAGIPVVGPALGGIAAAAAVATGVAQIQNIKSQSFGGGGGGAGGGFDAGGAAGGAAGGTSGGSDTLIDAVFNIQSESGNVSADQIRGVAAGLNELIEDGGKLRSVTVI